jgi:hypothetical protein
MRVLLWLRISAIVSFVFAAGHTLGGFKSWSPVGETPVLAAMRTTQYDVQGASRTYLDFYRGFGYALSVSMLLQGIILWQLCAIARTNPVLVRPIVGSFAAASLAGFALNWAFLFPVPTIFSAALSGCLIVTFLAAK